jgi:hypothetical protein
MISQSPEQNHRPPVTVIASSKVKAAASAEC